MIGTLVTARTHPLVPIEDPENVAHRTTGELNGGSGQTMNNILGEMYPW